MYRVVLLALLFVSTAQAGPMQILAVEWDSAEYDVVRQMYLQGHLPHLQKLGGLGQLTAITPCAPEAGMYWPCQLTITAVQNATMLTGLDFTAHGIDDNRDFILKHPIPPGLTIF